MILNKPPPVGGTGECRSAAVVSESAQTRSAWPQIGILRGTGLLPAGDTTEPAAQQSGTHAAEVFGVVHRAWCVSIISQLTN